MIDEKLVKEHREKIAQTLTQCIYRMSQKADGELLPFMREQNKSLIEWLEDEQRWLAVIAGEKVEPKQIHAEAVLVGTLGGSS